MPNFTNGWQTTISGALTSVATTVTVGSTTGMPAVPFNATIASEGANTAETILVTANSSGTLTIIRGFELNNGNAASAHSNGAAIGAVLSAQVLVPATALAMNFAYHSYR